MDRILEITNLSVFHETPRGTVRAVNDVSLHVESGESLAIVGESGCGKSTLGRAIVGLTYPTSGTIVLNGTDVSRFGRREWRDKRSWAQVIFQDPYAALNPRKTIGSILGESLKMRGIPKADRPAMLVDLLETVGLRGDALQRYPHEFSGGQRQRVGIARAVAVNPKLIVCDEPVSALDVSVQGQIINLLVALQERQKLSYLFISHDLSVVQHIADRIAVMYLGRIVEVGTRSEFWSNPRHPYTRALLDAVPMPELNAARRERKVLQGEIPSPFHLPSGCAFRTRCPEATERCAVDMPVLHHTGERGSVACHFN